MFDLRPLKPVRKFTDPGNDPGILSRDGEETEVLIDTQWGGCARAGGAAERRDQHARRATSPRRSQKAVDRPRGRRHHRSASGSASPRRRRHRDRALRRLLRDRERCRGRRWSSPRATAAPPSARPTIAPARRERASPRRRTRSPSAARASTLDAATATSRGRSSRRCGTTTSAPAAAGQSERVRPPALPARPRAACAGRGGRCRTWRSPASPLTPGYVIVRGRRARASSAARASARRRSRACSRS